MRNAFICPMGFSLIDRNERKKGVIRAKNCSRERVFPFRFFEASRDSANRRGRLLCISFVDEAGKVPTPSHDRDVGKNQSPSHQTQRPSSGAAVVWRASTYFTAPTLAFARVARQRTKLRSVQTRPTIQPCITLDP